METSGKISCKNIYGYQQIMGSRKHPISMSILPSLQDIQSQYTVVSNTDQDNQSIKKYAIANFEECKSDCDDNANCAGMVTSDKDCWTIKQFSSTYYNSGYSLHRKGQTFNKGIKKKENFYYGFLTNAQNIEDETQCEYVTQTDANVNPANQQMVSDIFVWTSITLGLILCLFYFLKLINEKIVIEPY